MLILPAASTWLSFAFPRIPLRLEGVQGTIDAPENLRPGILARLTVVDAIMVTCAPRVILSLMIVLIIL